MIFRVCGALRGCRSPFYDVLMTVKDLSLTLTLGKCRYTGEVISDTVPNGSGEAWYADGRYYKGHFDYGVMHDKRAYFR